VYIFIYVSVTGYTAPAIAQNRVGPLLAQPASGGCPVRARGGRLRRRGFSCPCYTFATWASV